MKERPILFGAPMVRAILDGRKSQTRRVVKPQPYIDGQGNFCWNSRNFGQDFNGPHIQAIASPIPSSKTKRVHCPFGKPGDRLWVREAWATHSCFDAIPPRDLTTRSIHYQADGKAETGKYRQAFHMPRWASRILLEITAVRVERLQDISEDDALAEGVTFKNPVNPGHAARMGREAFAELWQSINGPDSWDENPWVWVIEFKRVQP